MDETFEEYGLTEEEDEALKDLQYDEHGFL